MSAQVEIKATLFVTVMYLTLEAINYYYYYISTLLMWWELLVVQCAPLERLD